MRGDYQLFKQKDTEIIAVGPEKKAPFQKYWEQNDIPFIGIPDPKRTVLNLYGQEIKLLKLGRMPAQVLVDKNGLIRYAQYGESMSDIPSNEEILNLVPL